MKKYIYILISILMVSCGKISKEGEMKNGSKGIKPIFETGELAAVNSKSFTLPRYGPQWYQMKIIGMLEHGSIVNAGDSILQIDPTNIQNFIVGKESSLETELATLEKMRVTQENTLNSLDSQIKNELATFELRKIELEASRFETEKIRKIKELEFKQAEIQLAKEKRKMELSRIMIKNDSKIQEIRVDQLKTDIKNAYNILPQLTIRTPIPGVFQSVINWNTEMLTKAGDDVYSGNNMANVPDLEWMKVNTFVDENDFLRVTIGQKVAVRLDAMPKVIFEGKVSSIGRLCKRKDNKSRQKVFDIEVVMLKSDERLKPGMTVSCEFL